MIPLRYYVNRTTTSIERGPAMNTRSRVIRFTNTRAQAAKEAV